MFSSVTVARSVRRDLRLSSEPLSETDSGCSLLCNDKSCYSAISRSMTSKCSGSEVQEMKCGETTCDLDGFIL